MRTLLFSLLASLFSQAVVACRPSYGYLDDFMNQADNVVYGRVTSARMLPQPRPYCSEGDECVEVIDGVDRHLVLFKSLERLKGKLNPHDGVELNVCGIEIPKRGDVAIFFFDDNLEMAYALYPGDYDWWNEWKEKFAKLKSKEMAN